MKKKLTKDTHKKTVTRSLGSSQLSEIVIQYNRDKCNLYVSFENNYQFICFIYYKIIKETNYSHQTPIVRVLYL